MTSSGFSFVSLAFDTDPGARTQPKALLTIKPDPQIILRY
jgi:hypothetical protein